MLDGELKKTKAYCVIINSHLITISPNGEFLKPDFTYKFIMTKITNPNMKLDAYTFTISTYHNDDIY